MDIHRTSDALLGLAQGWAQRLLALPPVEQAEALAWLRDEDQVVGILVEHLIGADAPLVMCGRPRDPQWPRVARAHLEARPRCAACNGKDLLQVHHVLAYHEHPELELDPHNLLTLCMKNRCHFVLGHHCLWTRNNSNVVMDAAALLEKIKTRP